jgi:hypothetical protein
VFGYKLMRPEEGLNGYDDFFEQVLYIWRYPFPLRLLPYSGIKLNKLFLLNLQ